MSNQVILYDLPTKGDKPRCFSPNPLKPRILMNYKGIPYKTEWVEYPDLEPRFKELGMTPTSDGQPTGYTSPAVRFTDGRYLIDSKAIAEDLERQYPSPCLHLDSPMLPRVEALFMETIMTFAPAFLTQVPNVLSERSAQYFSETREKIFGAPLEAIYQTKGDESWEAVRVPFGKAVSLMNENAGPYFMGETVSYADIVYVAMIQGFRVCMGEEAFERICKMEPAIDAHYKACEIWLKRDTY